MAANDLPGLQCAQLTGPVVVPFNVQKQTALLSALARSFPRTAFGLGPDQTQIVKVLSDAATNTIQVTIVTESGGSPQLFAEVRNPRIRVCPPCVAASWVTITAHSALSITDEEGCAFRL